MAARADMPRACSMSPENSDAAHGRMMPSHCSCDRPSVGSQSPSVSDQLSSFSSRAFAAAKAVRNAWRPGRFQASDMGHRRVGMIGETNRGVGSPGFTIVIDAGNAADGGGAATAGGNRLSDSRSAV